jgi:hypothetical protein
MEIAGRGGFVGVEVAMGINPDQTQMTAASRTGDRTEGQAVVAAQDEGQAAALHGTGNALCQLVTDGNDTVQVAQTIFAGITSFTDRHMNISQIAGLAAAGLQIVLQPGIADGAGTHIHAAPSSAIIDGDADDIDMHVSSYWFRV